MVRWIILGSLVCSLAAQPQAAAQSRETIAAELKEARDLIRDMPPKAHALLDRIAHYPTLRDHPDLRLKNIQLILEYEGRMKIFEQSEALFAEGMKLLEQVKDPKAEIDLLLGQASYAYDNERIDGVRTLLNRAYELSLKIGDVESQAVIISEQGNVDRQELNYQSALIHYLQAVDLLKNMPHGESYERVANQLAVFYLEGLTVRYDQGIQILEDLVNQVEKAPQPRRQDLQILISNLGFAYSKKGDFAKALKSFERAMKLAVAIEDWTGLAYCQGYVGNVLIKEKKWNEALQYFLQAQQYFLKTKNQTMLMAGSKRLMSVYLELGNEPAAANAWKTVQTEAEKNLPLDVRVEHMRLQGRLAALQKRWKDAFEAFEQMNKLEDKLNAQKNADSARYYTALFNIERKEQENRRLEQKGRVQVLQLENKRKQSEVLSWILVSVGIIAAIFAVDFVRVRKRRRKIQDLTENVQKNLLQRYLPHQTVEAVLSGREQLDVNPQQKRVTLLHCEICDFTRAVDLLGPLRMGRILNVYLSEMMEIIGSEGGIVDKFINGSLLAVFGTPASLPNEQQAQAAVRCARRMQARLEELNRNWQRTEGWVFALRIGMHQGEGLVGLLGAEPRTDYTVVGPVVDTTAQICSRGTPGDTMVSAALATYLDPQSLMSVSRLRSGTDGEIFTLLRASA